MADNIYTKIMKIRKEFSETEITKTGRNNYQKYDYLKLEDFVPIAIALCNKYDVYTHVNIGLDGFATMSVVSTDNIDDSVIYKLRIPELPTTEFKLKREIPLNATTMIQDMGKLETYARRYLYYLFLDLAVPDEVDAGKLTNNNNSSTFNKSTSKQNSKDSNKSFDKGYEEQVVEDRYVPRETRENNVDVKDPEPLQTLYNQAVNELTNENSEVTKSNLRVKASSFKREGKITATQLKDLIKFINETEGLEP